LQSQSEEAQLAIHEALRAEARKLYEDSLNPVDRALDWQEALLEARMLIKGALRASDCLADIESALAQSGANMLVFRHLMAPPTSQDQFKLICHDWPKNSEKSSSAVNAVAAAAVARCFHAWRSSRLTPWLADRRQPTRREIERVLAVIAPLIASQRVATARRNRLALKQEQDLIARLEALGWIKRKSKLIDNQAPLAAREFMHKARFASGRAGRAEVDIALGLRNTVVLAMECKVTNDETNSVKRINDVVKKADAWKDHWGNFVQPAALLQGVVKLSDVRRLLDKNIQVFWSHRLDLFETWLNERF
jgi:XamI restriction endonuclease